jgi:hypothetical protein
MQMPCTQEVSSSGRRLRPGRNAWIRGWGLVHSVWGHFWLHFCYFNPKMAHVTIEMFSQEIAEAMSNYDRFVICIDKAPDEFHASLISLLNKAIKAYENRGPQLRHGIALDKFVTIILSQSDIPKPLCGIYFNLHSPYQKQSLPRTVKAVTESIGESKTKQEG